MKTLDFSIPGLLVSSWIEGLRIGCWLEKGPGKVC